MLPARFLILALIIFELLNLVGILNFTLDFSWLGLLVTSGVTFILVEAIYYGFKKNGILLPVFPYFMVALGLWFDAMGDVGHLYGKFIWYDQAAHVLGGSAVMSMAIGIVSRYTRQFKISVLKIIIVSLAFTALFGDLYELEEYLEDVFYHGHQVRLGDGPDTANDLMLNLTGGLLMGAAYIVFKKNQKKL